MEPKEFKNIAPNLFELKKLKSAFGTPKDYFDSVEENSFNALFLDSIGDKNEFDIPENYFDLVEPSVFEKIKFEDNSIPKNYFDTVEDRVFEKISKETKILSIKKRVLKKVVPIAVAASILLVFTLQYFNNQTYNEFATLDDEDIEYWIENGELNFNDTELAFLYEETEIEGVSVFDFYEEEEVFDYLNELDVESLILTN